MGYCLSCLKSIPGVDGCISAFTTWRPVAWLMDLKAPGWLRVCGIALSFLATNLVAIAISTDYWVKRFVQGIFVYRGLWKDCSLEKCTYLKDVPSYIAVSIFFMLVSAVTCFGSVVYGTLCLTPYAESKNVSCTTVTIILCSISGFTGGIGLINFMRSATQEPNTFLSWSLAPGWFSVIVVSMAGVCHFVAKRWEEEELAELALTTTTIFTLEEECAIQSVDELYTQRMRKKYYLDSEA